MTPMDKVRLERAAKVAQVIAENPDLPMICLAPSTPSDFDSYYYDVCGASVEKLLFPNEVNRMYSFPCKGLPNGIAFSYFGLNPERYYNDIDEVAEEIEDWLWDSECGQFLDSEHQNLKCYDWVTDGWIQTYRPIARMMAEDMPWHDYIVIDCY